MENKNKNHENGNNTSNRGFASMPHEKVEEIARKGGKASHKETAEKGHKGAHASHSKGKNEGMAEKGRAGGHASGKSKGSNKEE